jgi:uncharacterized glyoxalase superfamily protein PhnB
VRARLERCHRPLQTDLGSVEQFRLAEPSGRIGHAELKFGQAIIMLPDEYPEFGIHGPQSRQSLGSCIWLHVDDVNAMTAQAAAALAFLTM